MLYPLKFKPILKERIWGGDRLRKVFQLSNGKTDPPIGECWSLSAVDGNLSVVENGYLAGNTIEELVEVYMGDLVGDNVYQRFGVEFPLLVKLIDTSKFLSVQVHPDDEMAKERHHAFGKSEFWYILNSNDESKIITGFNKKFSRDELIESVKDGSLKSQLKYVNVKPHDFIYIPSKSLHSLGEGVFLVEIQQTSDVTYRVYDWDRVDDRGKSRELHLELAVDTIDFSAEALQVESLSVHKNASQELLSSPYFQVNRLVLNQRLERDFFEHDSFRVYICIGGEAQMHSLNNDPVLLKQGELVLVPASLSGVVIEPVGEVSILEVLHP